MAKGPFDPAVCVCVCGERDLKKQDTVTAQMWVYIFRIIIQVISCNKWKAKSFAYLYFSVRHK